MKHNTRAVHAIAIGLVLVSTTARAQSPASNPEANTLDTIQVTASRAARSYGFLAPTPTTLVNGDDLRDANISVVADQLNKLPALHNTWTPASTSHRSQGGGGNYLDLRGMGAGRTLVLVNGYRHVATNSDGWVDTNAIPAALVERVEVVTGGASASWGSDAVAGVVNLILKPRFEGIEGRFGYGISEHGDGAELNAALSGGSTFAGGRGHLLMAAEFPRHDGIGANRDWNLKHYQVMNNPAWTADNGQPRQLILPETVLSTATLGGLITSGPLRGLQFLPGGETAPFRYGEIVGTQYMIGGDGFNAGDLIHLVTPLKRSSAYLRSTLDVGEYTQIWLDASVAQTSTDFNLSTSYNLGNITIRRDNPYLPGNVQALMDANGVDIFNMGRVHEDIAYNVVDAKNRTHRLIGGIKGRLGEDWDFDAAASFGRNHYRSLLRNNLLSANFTRAVDAVADAQGNIICRSQLSNPDNGCVPVNLFGYGSPSAQAIDYLTGTQWLDSILKQRNVAVNLRGEPFSTWAGTVALAAGVEYRHESVDQRVDEDSQASRFRIGNPKAMQGAYRVNEAYVEMIAPLLAEKPGVQLLDITLGVRGADYSESGFTKPWKLGLSYSVNPDWRFRLTRSRDIRAPSISHMYNSYALSFGTLVDPANGLQSTVRTPSTGNTDLSPEIAQTIAAGIVWQPQWLPGFQASLDWYDIDLSGAIATLSAQAMLDRCAAGNLELCSAIVRNPDGSLLEVQRKFLNISSIRTRGVDMELSYSTTLPMAGTPATLDLRLMASHMREYLVNDGNSTMDLARDVVNGIGPDLRGMFSAALERERWRLHLDGKYSGSSRYNAASTYNRNHVGSNTVFNLALHVKGFERGSQHLTFFAGVKNLLDRDPPIAPYTFIFGSSSLGYYDVMGRRYTIGLRFNY